MNTGMVQGGWEFVIAAYTVTALGFIIYAIRLFAALKGLKRHD